MGDANRPEILRGHIDECVEHLKRKLAVLNAKSVEKKQIISALATFCGATEGAVLRWQPATGTMPLADVKIKLMCFLDLLGYRVIELENLNGSLRGLTELIAFGLVTPAQAVTATGYSKISVLNKVLIGKKNSSKEKLEKIRQLVKDKKDELAQAKDKAQHELPVYIATLFLNSLQTEPETPEPDGIAIINAQKNTFMLGLLQLIQGLNTLLNSNWAADLDQELANLPDSQFEIIIKLADKLATLKNKLEKLKGQTGDANG